MQHDRNALDLLSEEVKHLWVLLASGTSLCYKS